MFDLIFFILFVLALTAVLGSISLAPWVPSRKRDFLRIIDMAALKPGEVFYDLGCGTGRLNAYVARLTSAKSVGIEITLPLYIVCMIRKALAHDPKPIYRLGNIYKQSISEADVVYLFAAESKRIGEKLKNKLKNELRSGSRVISYAFGIDGWEPQRVDKPTAKDITIYLYKINQT